MYEMGIQQFPLLKKSKPAGANFEEAPKLPRSWRRQVGVVGKTKLREIIGKAILGKSAFC